MILLFLEDPDVRRQLKNIACLSFVPESHMVEEFEKIEEESSESIGGQCGPCFVLKILIFLIISSEFIEYFEDNYIGRRGRYNRGRSPLFPIAFWNCFDRLDQQLPRTNNPQEGWHNAFQV